MPYSNSISPETVLGLISTSISEILPKDDDIQHLVFRKNMSEIQDIDVKLYDTISYYDEDEELRETEIVTYTEHDEIYIQVLKHKYKDEEYEYDVIGEEVPYYNMPWRNAIGFLGRIIKNEEVAYKGLIILQYDGTRHHVILQKPRQVNFGTFSQVDPTSLSYNALDPAPFVFEDLINEDGNAFAFPTVLGVIPYNIPFQMRNPGNIIKFAKTFSSFDKNQLMFLRPYFAIPQMPQLNQLSPGNSFFGLTLERIMYPNGPVESYNLSNNYDVNGNIIIDWNIPALQNFLYKIYDLSQSHNQVIRYRLVTTIIDDISFSVTEPHVGLVSLDQNSIKDIQQIGNNLEETLPGKEDITYRIRFSWSSPILWGGTEHYNAQVTIERERVLKSDEDGDIQYEVRQTTNNHVWDSNDARSQIDIVTLFEGISFTVHVASKEGSLYQLNTYEGEIILTVSASLSENTVSTGTSQPILLRGEKLVDPNEMLKQHNLKKATYLTGYDRFLLKYGPHTGSNVLQFMDYDDDSFAPFPFGAIDFDSEITHVHTHRGNIYVFTQGGLWILHTILDYINMHKTFAFSHLTLHPSEKQTVVSFGNEVFFISKNQGYVIRTNVNVESQDDVYVVPVTGPINNILKNPNHYIKQRLEEGYGRVINTFEDVKVHYYVKAMNNEIYIYASYFVTDIDSNKENIMLTFIFNRDHRRWITYDTIVGSYPLVNMVSGYAKGFDLMLKNDDTEPYTTYSSYVQYLPKNDENMVIGDIMAVSKGEFVELEREEALPIYDIKPISAMLDTGSLGFNSMHTKKIRRIHTTLMDLKGESFKFYVVPYLDNLDYQNRLTVEITTDENDQYIPDYIENVNQLGFSSIIPVIESQNLKQEGFRVTLASLQTTKKLTMITQLNARGKLPGFRIYFFVKDKMKIGEYGIVYRQQKAR